MMKVGTLDSLLSLADELARADTFAEGVVRKVERQISEAHVATKLAELSKGAGAGPAGGEDRAAGVNIPPLEFRAGGLPSAEYVRKFAWDAEQYDAKVRVAAAAAAACCCVWCNILVSQIMLTCITLHTRSL